MKRIEENYALWGLKTIAGIFILGILGIHYVVNHLIAPGGLLSYSDILAYYQNPIVPIMEIAFLVLVVVHASLGVRSIILDMHLSKTIHSILDIGLFTLGAIAIGYGIWIIVRVVQLGSN